MRVRSGSRSLPTALAIVATAGLVTWLPASPAAGQDDPDGPPRRGNPCAADIEHLCGDQPPGRGRVRRCMESKVDQLSPACREAFQRRSGRAQERFERVRSACESEIADHCPDVRQRVWQLRRCLAPHHEALSAGCLEALEEHERRPRWPGGGRGPGRERGAPETATDPE